MTLLSSILSCESIYGAVTHIAVDPAYLTGLVAELGSVDRDDLASLVAPGDAGHLVVTAGGTDWPFGGL